MKWAVVGRADLLRALAHSDPDHETEIGRLLGFGQTPTRPEPPISLPPGPGPRDRNDADTSVPPIIESAPLAPTPFWYAKAFAVRGTPIEIKTAPQTIPTWKNAPTEPPVLRLLAPWRDLLPQLQELLGADIAASGVDVEGVVEAWSRGRQLERLPRLRHRRLGPHVQLILDRSDRLVPFWDDQDVVASALRAWIPAHRLVRGIAHEGVEEPRLEDRGGQLSDYRVPGPGGIALVLGDLGCLEPGQAATDRWHELGLKIAASGGTPAALLPAPLDRCPSSLRTVWKVAPWERPAPEGTAGELSLRARAERLLTLVSPAVRVEPGFLRAVRRAIDPVAYDAGTEADVWQHPAIASRSAVAASFHPDAAVRLCAAFAAEPAEVQQRVLDLLQRWRHRLPSEIWFEEILRLPSSARANLPQPDDIDQARAFFAFVHGPAQRAADVIAWLDRVAIRATADAKSVPEVAQAVAAAKQHDPGYIPDNVVDPAWIEGEDERLLEVRQRGDRIILKDADVGAPDSGSLLGGLRSGNGLVSISVAGDEKPPWADDWGHDAYGPWATFSVIGRDGRRVTQRLRWCPAGSFLMGSPEDEEGRWEDEGPRHEVALRHGFWMFETACTEALWEAVTGRAPEPRRGAAFPITNVSWEDAQSFLRQINAARRGLDLGLPSEAQWEYACRAGTDTPYSFGTTINREQACFDSYRPVPVGGLPPNGWGLHEMHGNVFDWCADHWHENYAGAPKDESAWIDTAAGAANRVFRGGSWINSARNVRAAYRSNGVPAYRFVNLGFRCARVQAASELSDATLLRVCVSEPAPIPRGSNLLIRTDREELRLGKLTKPDWASAIGRDAFGLFTDVTLPDTEITQWLRWIPPGRFQMGSPEGEEGRFDGEGPRHEVTITAGFWLFDTPCTQALWEAVMGDNPSQFRSPTRPVEQVSFEDVQAFLDKLNARIPGLDLGLPSEAQWEYACRAGTETATWAGDFQIIGENNAPVLDPIAWYGGNSGVGFELENGSNSGDWPEKQYSHTRAGTRPVGLKAANPWGLHDMLGNVWEWCADHWHDDYTDAPKNGSAWIDTGRRGAANRVFRGGSWLGDARDVRAAFRGHLDPAIRIDLLGFRCARVQSDSVASEAERRAGRNKRRERSEQAATTSPKRRGILDRLRGKRKRT